MREGDDKAMSRGCSGSNTKTQPKLNSNVPSRPQYAAKHPSKGYFPFKKYQGASDTSSLSDITVLSSVDETKINIDTLQPSASTVSLDLTKGKDTTFTNYQVKCETKKTGSAKNKHNFDDLQKNTDVTDF